MISDNVVVFVQVVDTLPSNGPTASAVSVGASVSAKSSSNLNSSTVCATEKEAIGTQDETEKNGGTSKDDIPELTDVSAAATQLQTTTPAVAGTRRAAVNTSAPVSPSKPRAIPQKGLRPSPRPIAPLLLSVSRSLVLHPCSFASALSLAHTHAHALARTCVCKAT